MSPLFQKKELFPCHLKTEGAEGYFEGYASVFHLVDSQGDSVLPGAFNQSLEDWREKNQWPKLLWQHNQQEPLGQWLELREDTNGLYVKGQLLLDIQRSREAYALLKAGVIDSLSIGYRVKETTRGTERGQRLLKTIDLVEISLVTFPANQDAKIHHVKEDRTEIILEKIQRATELMQA